MISVKIGPNFLFVVWKENKCVEFENISVFAALTKMTDLTFLPMFYILTDDPILSHDKMLSYAKDLIPDICWQHLNNSKLHK